MERKDKYKRWNPSDLITGDFYPFEFEKSEEGLSILFYKKNSNELVLKMIFEGVVQFYSESNSDLRIAPCEEIRRQLGDSFLLESKPYVEVMNSSLIDWLDIESKGYIEAVKDLDLFESNLRHYILFHPGNSMFEVITQCEPRVVAL